jgi:hypothetical protein
VLLEDVGELLIELLLLLSKDEDDVDGIWFMD